MLDERLPAETVPLFELLEQLQIPYVLAVHKVVYTIAEADELQLTLPGEETKNIFCKDKHSYYLYVLPEHKRADMKLLRKQIGAGSLTFAKEEELMEKLHLIPGSVTPLGLLNNRDKDVTLVLDRELEGKTIWVHPNTNTATVSLALDQVIRFAEHLGIRWLYA